MRRSLSSLQILAVCKPNLRKMLLEHAPTEVFLAICECSLNLLKGVIPLTPRQKRMLLRYKTHLRALANKKVSKKRKKRYLHEGGGLLTTVLPPVLNVLGKLLV
jgi:hypothetical protein